MRSSDGRNWLSHEAGRKVRAIPGVTLTAATLLAFVGQAAAVAASDSTVGATDHNLTTSARFAGVVMM
jgi:hypothetical protein